MNDPIGTKLKLAVAQMDGLIRQLDMQGRLVRSTRPVSNAMMRMRQDALEVQAHDLERTLEGLSIAVRKP